MKRILIFLLCVITVFSLSSCVEEESEESLKMPDDSTIVTYTISDTEEIRLLCNSTYSDFGGFGEWIKDGEVSPILYTIDYKYWGFFASRNGITDIVIMLSRIDGVTAELEYNSDQIVPVPMEMLTYPDDLIGRLDEGMLNSTSFTYYDHDAGEYETEPSLAIRSITVEHTDMEMFNWASDEWRQFTQAASDGILRTDEADLWYSFAEERGEWITNGVAIPIKIELIEYAPTLIIYDVSGDTAKIILFGSGESTDGVTLVLDELSTSMFYGNTVQTVTVRIVSSIESPETEEPSTEPITGPITDPLIEM